MLWYVLARYVHTLLGRTHLDGEVDREHELVGQPHVHLTHYELFGLKEIVMFLYDLPPQRKNVPELISDPVQLIKDVRSLVERHCKDSPELAITGKPVLHPDMIQLANNGTQPRSDENKTQPTSQIKSEIPEKMEINSIETSVIVRASGEQKDFQPPKIPNNKTPAKASNKRSGDGVNGNERTNGNASNAPRRRRRRCKVCVPCNSTECGHCAFCLDMVILDRKFCRNGRISVISSFIFQFRLNLVGPVEQNRHV